MLRSMWKNPVAFKPRMKVWLFVVTICFLLVNIIQILKFRECSVLSIFRCYGNDFYKRMEITMSLICYITYFTPLCILPMKTRNN